MIRWDEAEGYRRYLELSLKGSTKVDWNSSGARRGFLAAIVADTERSLVAKVFQPPRSGYFTNQDFPIDLEARRCTCLAGEVTPASTASGATATDTGSGFRASPLSSRGRSVMAVSGDRGV